MPAAGAVLVFRRSGQAVARVTTRSNGTYRVTLRPGMYTVVAPRYRIGTGVWPRTVRVPKGRVVRVDLEIDTGIQ
jgi:Carboxypeptidase regulatory-like domain